MSLVEELSEQDAFTSPQWQLHAKQHPLMAGCTASSPGCPLLLASAWQFAKLEELHHIKPFDTDLPR